MKRMRWMIVATALLLCGSLVSAQSIAEVARATRKSKAQQGTTVKYFDNDNLPRDQKLSVVGPQPSTDTDSASNSSASDKDAQTSKDAGNTGTASDSKAAATSTKTATDEKAAEEAIKAKVEAQKQKIESMSKDLDVTEREYRLRVAAMYADAGNRLRNADEWDKEEAQYKKDIADKQAALEAAKLELQNLEEQERTGDNPADKSNPIR